MLGPPKPRQLDEPMLISLDDLVPQHHLYRHLERTLDLAFVRELVRDTYAGTGRPSIVPVAFVNLQLIMFVEGLRSEHQLMRVVADRLSLRWYLGDDLSEPLPDHSSLGQIRERYGVAIFRRFFEAIVEQCGAAGLVWGEERSIDSTDVTANAALDSPQPRFAVEAHLTQLFTTEPTDTARDGSGDDDRAQPDEVRARTPLPVARTAEARAALAEQAAARHDWIGAVGRPDRTETNGPDRRTSDFRVGTTDPDATPLRPTAGRTRLGDHDHDVVDGGKARIILTTLVTPAVGQDNQPAVDLRRRTRFRWKLHSYQVTGDSKYATVENIVAIEDEHIHTYVPLSAAGHRPGRVAEQDVRSDAAADLYVCPGEQMLRFLSQSDVTHRRIDLAAACAPCALRGCCTSSPRGRRISRSLDEGDLDRIRSDHATESYEGNAQTEGLGGALRHGGQGVARLAPLPPSRVGEGHRCSVGERRRAESQALAQQTGLGTAVMAERSTRDSAPEPMNGRHRAVLTPSPLPAHGWPGATPRQEWPFFNRLGCL